MTIRINIADCTTSGRIIVSLYVSVIPHNVFELGSPDSLAQHPASMASPRTPPSGLEPEVDFDRQVSNEKASVAAPIYSSTEEPSREQHFKVVARGDPLSSSDDVRGDITGYNDSLMRARATLSSTEEKKLLRRIDWHLIPLLAVMYMVKTIDASNVCGNTSKNIHFRAYSLFRFLMLELWIEELLGIS